VRELVVAIVVFLDDSRVCARNVCTVGIVWVWKAAIQNVLHKCERIAIKAFLRCYFTSVDSTCLVAKVTHVMSSEDDIKLDHIFFTVASLDIRSQVTAE
jgi:hypothetical protein